MSSLNTAELLSALDYLVERGFEKKRLVKLSGRDVLEMAEGWKQLEEMLE